jgi:hypothetical protein
MHGMKLGIGWSVALALVACGGGGNGSDGQTDSDSGTGTTQGSGPTESSQGEASQTGTTTGIGGMSESQTDTTAGPTGETTVGAMSGTDTTLTTGTSVTTLETTETPDTSDTSTGSSSDDTSSGSESTSSGESTEGTTDGTSGTTEVCVPAVEVCNDVDDDCDGNIDDVDVGMDGICDCLSIALVGNQGSLDASQFVAYLQSKGTSVERINSNVLSDIDAPLTPAVLAKYDIIILDWLQRTYTPQESADVRAWVEAGGGLMTMTGHENIQVTIDRCNSFISPLGLTYNGDFFDGPVTQFAMHPITEGLTSITFLGGLYVDIVEDGVGMNEVIMTLPPGPVGVVQERVDGRVFVFGDEWVEFDSEWSQMPEIQQFWVQTLSWLGPQNSCVVPQ